MLSVEFNRLEQKKQFEPPDSLDAEQQRIVRVMSKAVDAITKMVPGAPAGGSLVRRVVFQFYQLAEIHDESARIAGQIAREHVPPLDASRRRAHLHQAHLGGVAHQAAGLPPACEGAAARAPAM